MQDFVTTLSKVRQKSLCILNGVFGDSLAQRKLSVALKMRFFREKEIKLTQRALKSAGLPESDKICVLVHGSCGSNTGWSFKSNPEDNYGSLLQKDFGHTPFYVRYNSGLHISSNGKRFSDMMEKLIKYYPHKLRDIVLIGHSMGGLVFRSACHYAEKEKKKWVKRVSKIFYIGSPHLGTHLEKLGKFATSFLNHIPTPVTKFIGGLGDLRSDGVKDLRHGYITHEDWQNEKADNFFYWPKNKTPLLKNAEHYLICGTISKVEGSKIGRLFGDGLVHPASGTGQGLFASSAIPFRKENCKVITGISHHKLQTSPRVYEQIKNWCTP